MKLERKWQIFFVVVVLNIVADQLTKMWARASLELDPRGLGIPRPVIDGLWDWRLSYNKGSAFGLFHGTGGARVFLTLIGIGALIAVYFMVRGARNDQTRLVNGLGLVAGGAIGNLIDRIYFGKVTDFVVLKYYDRVEWPTFNVADISLVVGVAYMLIDMQAEKRREKAGKAGKTDKADKAGSKVKKRKKKPARDDGDDGSPRTSTSTSTSASKKKKKKN